MRTFMRSISSPRTMWRPKRSLQPLLVGRKSPRASSLRGLSFADECLERHAEALKLIQSQRLARHLGIRRFKMVAERWIREKQFAIRRVCALGVDAVGATIGVNSRNTLSAPALYLRFAFDGRPGPSRVTRRCANHFLLRRALVPRDGHKPAKRQAERLAGSSSLGHTFNREVITVFPIAFIARADRFASADFLAASNENHAALESAFNRLRPLDLGERIEESAESLPTGDFDKLAIALAEFFGVA